MSSARSRVVVRPAHHHDADNFRRLPLCRLNIGKTLQFPIHADDGTLLLADGSEITPRIVEILDQRGHTTVLVHRLEPATQVSIEPLGVLSNVPESFIGASIGIHNRATRLLDGELCQRIAHAQEVEESPFLQEVPRRGVEPFSHQLAREISKKHEVFVDSLRDAVSNIISSRAEGQEQATAMVKEYLDLLVEDIDLFANIASAPHASYYPHRHSLHVAMLSLAMGVRAGLGEESLRTLGLGALLHDVGMLRVPRQVWSSRQTFTAPQALAVMAHPIYSVEALSHLDSIPPDVHYIAYQVHERAGGQGYPRRIPADLIHPLAKIVSTADMYIAMLSDRPHRRGIQPYRAVEAILRGVQNKQLEAEPVRLLLRTIALFPVGSYVLLSDGRLAKVMRSNEDRYDRPVVRAWAARTPPSEEAGEILDLSADEDLRVVEAVPSPASVAG